MKGRCSVEVVRENQNPITYMGVHLVVTHLVQNRPTRGCDDHDREYVSLILAELGNSHGHGSKSTTESAYSTLLSSRSQIRCGSATKTALKYLGTRLHRMYAKSEAKTI